MTGIDAQLTREFFELSGFRVHTSWAPHQRSDGAVQIYVENPQAPDHARPDPLLTAKQVHSIRRALVEVRPWHTDRLYASVIENNPVLTQFALDDNLIHAREFFDNAPFVTILVTSELPATPEQRLRSLRALEATPVHHVLEFPAILRRLIAAVNINSAYAASPTLQLIQLLKRYRLIQHQQMEFQFPLDGPPMLQTPIVETTILPDEQDKYEDDEWE